MIGERQKRPQSKHHMMRPLTSKVSEANLKQSQQCFMMGKKHMAKKQYPEALRHYFNATIHNPLNYKAFCNMGTILKELGNYKEAKNTYLRALAAKPDDHISLYNFGNLNRISGDQDAAIPLYQKVIQLKEQNKAEIGAEYSSSILNLGVCFKNVGKLDEAIDQYSKFIQISPEQQSGYFNKGMCYLAKLKKINRANYSKVHGLLCEEASKILEEALQRNKDNAQTKIALIELKYQKSPTLTEYESALEEYGKLGEQLSKNENPSKENEDSIRIKMSYCRMEIQKFKTAKSSPNNNYDKISENTKDPDVKSNIQVLRPSSGLRPQTGKSLTSKFDAEFRAYLDEGKYTEALDIVNSLPDGQQKFEKQILANFLNGQQVGEEIFFKVAKQIYDEKVAGKQITQKSCSIDGHQICAALLVELHEYEAATRHYEILMHILQEKKSLSADNKAIGQSTEDELERVRNELGILYAEREMYEPAIQEFKKNLQQNPNNYTNISSLGLCLIESNQKEEALKLYQSYLSKNYPNYKEQENLEIDEEEKRVTYVDCLINVAICEKEAEKEVEALKRAKKQIERLFPSYAELQNAFLETNNHLGVYLRLTEIYEQKVENIPYSEAKQTNQELLDFYLGCLQYPQCPDRNQILVNCGILFYLSGCYANAYLIYSKIQDKNISNDLGLTLAHLQEYQQSLFYLNQSVQKQPQNIVYAANFEIIKWVCGLYQQSYKNKLTEEYPCRCSHMVYARSHYGLALIDYLTEILSKHYDKTVRKPETNIQEQTNELIDFLVGEFQKISVKKKFIFLSKYMKAHIKGFPVHEEKFQIKKIDQKLIEGALKIYEDIDSFQKFIEEIFDFVKTLPPNPYFSTYSQLLLYFSLFRNRSNQLAPYFLNRSLKSIFPLSHATPSLQQLNKDWANEQNIKVNWHSQYPVLDAHHLYFEEFYTADAKNDEIKPFVYEVPIKYPNSQINCKNFCYWMRDIESAVENDCQLLMEYVEEVYYQSEGVVEPFRKQIRYPRCKDFSDCENCLLKSLRISSAFFKSYMHQELQTNVNFSYKKSVKTVGERVSEFCKNGIHQSDLYSPQTQTITFEITPYTTPFVLSTHHHSFQQLSDFIKILNPGYSLKLHEGDQQSRGVRFLYINKRIVLQLWWGELCENPGEKSKQELQQLVTSFDKFGTWWHNTITAPGTQATLMLQELIDLDKLPEKFNWSSEDSDQVPDGIKLIRYWGDNGEQLYKKSKKILLNINSPQK